MVREFADLSVDARTHKPLRMQVSEQLNMFSLPVLDYRRHQQDFASFGEVEYLVDHLADGLGLQGNVVVRASRVSYPRIQQPEVIINLGNCPHR